MLALAPLWLLALLALRARWYASVALAWAPVLYNLVGLPLLDRWPAAFLLAPSVGSGYGAGTPLSMVIKSLAASGPTIGLLALVGCTLAWRRRGAWIVPAVYAAHLLVQTVIYWQGAFGSGGYTRFFVSTAPLAAICALRALNHLTAAEPSVRRRALAVLALVTLVAWAGVELELVPQDEAWVYIIGPVRSLARVIAAVIIVAALATAASTGPHRRFVHPVAAGLLGLFGLAGIAGPVLGFVRPHALPRDAADIRAAVTWLRGRGLVEPPPITTNIWSSYFLDANSNLTVVPGSRPLADVEPGAVLIWDADYSEEDRFGIGLDMLRSDSRWHLLWAAPPRDDGTIFARVFQYRPSEPD
jgi:hypothetical protein